MEMLSRPQNPEFMNNLENFHPWLMHLCYLVAYIVNNMHPDKTVPLGVFASTVKVFWSAFKYSKPCLKLTQK